MILSFTLRSLIKATNDCIVAIMKNRNGMKPATRAMSNHKLCTYPYCMLNTHQ